MATDEGSQDTLRLQFKAMQEMQQKRLQKQMEKKKEKELSLKSRSDDQKESLEVSDDFSPFQAGEQNAKNSFEQRVLEDEIEQLQDELRETVDENGRLYKLLKERDFEIKHLKKKIEEDRFVFTGTAGMAGDMVATKIVELSKKNRVLMAESEGAKTKVKQLTNRIQELELELQTTLARLPAKGATDTGAKPLRTQTGDRALLETPEVKALQDKLAATNLKMSDLRNQIQTVKQELRMAQKVLASEVGEDVNVQQLLSSPGTWRGRAQQILVLQSKVRELEKQLGQTRSQSVGTASDELSIHPDPRKLSAQEKHLLRIRSLERERQEGWEKLASERDALQREVEELKKKFEGVRSRNRVLSSEVKTLKSQMGTLVEKGRHDDELIDALMDQLKQLQEILGSLSLQEERTRASQHHLDQQLNSEAQQSSSLVAQLRAMVAEREAKVRQLEMEIGQLSVQYLRNKGVGEGSTDPEVSPTYTQFLEDPGLTKSPASAGEHGGRLGSSRSMTSLGHTLVESALTRPSLPSPHRTSPRFSDSPEQKGWQAQMTEIKALWQATEVERDRLTEFVTVLQKRVEESNNKLLESERKLQEERHRAVVLEQHLEKMRLEPGRTPASQRAALRNTTGLPTSNPKHNPTTNEKKDPSFAQLSDVPVESQMEELTTRLAIQVEENEMLKTALDSALRGKEEDFRIYHETLGQVKGVFLQALRQQKVDKQSAGRGSFRKSHLGSWDPFCPVPSSGNGAYAGTWCRLCSSPSLREPPALHGYTGLELPQQGSSLRLPAASSSAALGSAPLRSALLQEGHLLFSLLLLLSPLTAHSLEGDQGKEGTPVATSQPRAGGLSGEAPAGGQLLSEALLGTPRTGHRKLKLESGEWEAADKAISRALHHAPVSSSCSINLIPRASLPPPS
ncbi:coiled-coil domain-containing protein 13 [Carlito syrichta]|uniref:Coiled-coil domain-containing protein 13 n=1 Tax=Carlito syrichta TaxID=1868482 RepID=A0A1U7U9J8_CARSF|nr:coiled-coil domain-containing protein 13 [Carlito syrichta]